MSDRGSVDPDFAAKIADAERDAGVRRAQGAPFVEGVSGVCDECGHERPRLVGGLCAFCRDRRPGRGRAA